MNKVPAALVAIILSLGTAALAQPSPERAAELIRQEPEKVRAGYEDSLFPYKEILWQDVVECWGGGGFVGAKATCLACSIDDTSGQTYWRTDFPTAKWILPSTAVGIMAVRADFTYGFNGWSFGSYRPFAINYYSQNREPYHRADLANLAKKAPRECQDMYDTQGEEIVVTVP
jgi:hypothetical protein